ncbi:LysR family transcriptional regulator [Nocardiopsis sp. FIRDI 009]|uniref:LysR family transcriptional regulator n=1 Tax=Nocardiopsis sp. FIRDI 009 TaxID=714197 RepID=UPI000E239ACB|nr:LysR family transcriptional regulator [Nocardiopsis sp. FIRDI 009]
MIDLRRLRILRAVSHYGTVTAAARALHFTPSAASQQIRQLGRELDVTLLEPHGRGVRLTPAARTLLEHADAIEARWELAETDLRDRSDAPAGPLNAAAFPVALARLLAPMAAALGAAHPRLDIRLTEAEPAECLDLLFRGEADLAVIEAAPDIPPVTDTRFDQSPLMDDVLDLLVPNDHPLATRTTMPLAEAAGEDWVLPAPGTTCHAHAMSACGAAGFTPNGTHRVLDWGAVASVVAQGLGVALIPRLAEFSPHLPVTRLRLEGTPAPARKLITCTREGGRDRPAVAAALAELERIAPTVAA